MLKCRSRDTRPEILLRSRLHRAGLRFRVQIRPVPALRRTADIVFTRARVAVFVDGCFWHGCPAHYVLPATNWGYWSSKVVGNVARDRSTDQALAEAGWKVLRIWEHATLDEAEAAIRAGLVIG
jgi:DNA mismatch endonuclease (patch repair protein)